MNILFLSLGNLGDLNERSLYRDLLFFFRDKGHSVFVVCQNSQATEMNVQFGVPVLKVKTGDMATKNLIKKGISTVVIGNCFVKGIREFLKNTRFDVVMYSTPPITFAKVVRYIKKRDGAKSYLLLKDIFPQNAVDIGMLKKSGVKGLLYMHFRRVEKTLYKVSDFIGCMSQANVDYLLKHNPEVSPEKVEICPNSIEVEDKSVTAIEREEMRRKYNIPLDKKVFIYGGNLGKPQGIPFLIECLKTQLENVGAYFVVVGNGTEFGKLQTFFDEYKPQNMTLMKSLPKDDYDRLVAACDVGMIFLDHRFTIPNFPSRLLSYMQAKLPVLACTDPNTDVGKVIEEGNFGVWCESNDTSAFAKAVDKFGDKSWGENAFKYLCDNYSVESAYKTIMNCMEK